MKIDDSGRVIDFSEKPKGDELAKMRVDTTILGLSSEQAQQSPTSPQWVFMFSKRSPEL